MAVIKLVDSPRTVLETYNGPDSYVTGTGFVVTASGPSVIDSAVAINSSLGYISEVAAISGNNMTIKVYTSGDTEVTSGTNLTPVVITILEQGL